MNPRVADTHRALMAVSEMYDMGYDVFFPRERKRNQGVRVPPRQWHERWSSRGRMVYSIWRSSLFSYKQINPISSNTGACSSLSSLEQSRKP